MNDDKEIFKVRFGFNKLWITIPAIVAGIIMTYVFIVLFLSL